MQLLEKEPKTPESPDLRDSGSAQESAQAASRALRREQILARVFGHCAQIGYRRISMDEIAEAAGMSRTALYYYFSNKDAVYQSLSDWFYAEILRQAKAWDKAEQAQTLDLALVRCLEVRAKTYMDYVQDTPHGMRIVDLSGPHCGARASALDLSFRRLLIARFETGIEKEELSLARLNMSSVAASELLIACTDGLRGAVAGDWSHLRLQLSHFLYALLSGWGFRPSFRPKRLN